MEEARDSGVDSDECTRGSSFILHFTGLSIYDLFREAH